MRPCSGHLSRLLDQSRDGIVEFTRGRGPARLLDVVAGRSASALVGWVTDRNPAWRAGIQIAALDPYRGYAAEATHNDLICRDGAPPGTRAPNPLVKSPSEYVSDGDK
jgi:hypothetical protein